MAEQESYNVLIIEDTRELAEIIQIVLAKYDFIHTYTEADGQNAIVAYEEIRPEVILLDLNLPDMRGWHVLDEIRRITAEDGTAMPRVIVTTAYSDPANRVTGKIQEIILYLIKPFTTSEVERYVLISLGLLDEDFEDEEA